MDLKGALLSQYRAGFFMLRQAIERCPDELWAAGNHPRTFWRIAYHAVYYTHLYLMPTANDFKPWGKDQKQARILWDDDDEIPNPPRETTYTQAEVLDYLTQLEDKAEGWLDALDLEAETSGFSWYRIPKIDHQIVNVRHLGVHTGQLQELLYAQGIDLDWKGRA